MKREAIEIKEYIENMELLIRDGKITMNSLQIAEVTGKEHQNILKDIDDEINKIIISGGEEMLINSEGDEIFTKTEYKDSTGRSRPMYILSLEGIYQIMARYSAYVRRLIIARLEILIEISKIGERDLDTDRDIYSLHSIMKPFIYFIYEVYEKISNMDDFDPDEDGEYYKEEARAWNRRVYNEEDFLEWWEHMKRHQDDVEITDKINR